MKKILFLSLLILILGFGYVCYKRLLPGCVLCSLFQPHEKVVVEEKPIIEDRSLILSKINAKAQEAKSYAAAHNLNTHLSFLVNMEQHSGQKRFYVYDLQKNHILDTGLVAHGSGKQIFAERPKFGNTHGSGLSSLGKYKIGEKYKGRFGTAYRLHGLEASNNNAFGRAVVLHSFVCVPNDETYPNPLCNSLGCPMVSTNFLKKLSHLIDAEKKPIVLWVFD